MFWGDIHDIKRYSENTKENKNKDARKISSVILAAIQLMENYIKGIKKLSAYDASSIILSDANWICNNNKADFLDEDGNKYNVPYRVDKFKGSFSEIRQVKVSELYPNVWTI